MFYLPEPSSLPTIPVWLWVIFLFLTASGGYFGSWLSRKRRSTSRAEDDKILAEVRKLDIESLAELYDQLKDARAELTAMAQAAALRAEESRKAEAFLRDQVRFHEEVSIMARQAAHAAINEIQRCVWHIEQRDTAIREYRTAIEYLETELHRLKTEVDRAGLSLTVEFIKTQLPSVDPFAQIRHEAIVEYKSFPLPKPTE